MPRSGLFVTGTSTGVGKTLVSALLTLGLEAAYWKPVQCGLEEGGDRARVAALTGLDPARCLPEAYSLALAASPHLAAAAEGVAIQARKLALPPCDRALIVEGAGGLLVPLNWRHTMLDLAAWLRLPVVLVAETRLGTINHTLLSLGALRARRVRIAGVVLNGEAAEGLEPTLRAFGRAPLLGRVPPLAALTAAALRAAYRNLDTAALAAALEPR